MSRVPSRGLRHPDTVKGTLMLSWLKKRLRLGAKPAKRLPLRRRALAVEALEERYLLAAPVINPLGNADLLKGKPLFVPVTATADSALNYTVTTSNPLVTASVRPRSNPFLQLNVANFGTMTFELFRDMAPNTVDSIGGLVQAGFYDGLIFHRVVKDFVVQGGDQTGTGFGNPPFRFDDEFNANAIFTGNGQLAMANSGDDTNGTQFFITVGPQRHLDFKHTIFGQLVSGFDVLDAINNVPVNASSKPLSNVVISSATLIKDTTDVVVLLKAAKTFTGTASVTVRATDASGAVNSKSFVVTAQTDTVNDPAFMGQVFDVVTPVNTPVSFPLTAFDLEGSVIQVGFSDPQPNATASFDGKMMTIKPTAGFKGPIQFAVGVRRQGTSYPSDETAPQYNTQNITIGVGDKRLSGTARALTARAGVPLTDVTVATFTDPDTTSQPSNFTATINWGDGKVTAGTITKTGSVYTVSGTNTYARNGKYPLKVDIRGTATVMDNGGATLHLKSTTTVPTVSFSVDNSTVKDSSRSTMLRVELSEVDALPVTVNYAVSGGTASSNDFRLSSGTLTFAPGQTVKFIPVTILNDRMSGPTETLEVSLSAGNADLGAITTHTVSITNTVPLPRVSFVRGALSGQEGATPGLLKVMLSARSQFTVAVDYSVINGTALNGTDYNLAAGTLTFSPGESVKVIPIDVVDDALFEDNETIKVQLANPTQATLGVIRTATYTILNTDAAPTVNFNSARTFVDEGTSANLDVSLSAPAGKTVTVSYAVLGGTAKGGGVDYTLTNGTLTFMPGDPLTQSIPISVANDAGLDANETVKVGLTSVVGAVRGSNNTHIVSIVDPAAPPPGTPTTTVEFDAATLTISRLEGTAAVLKVVLSAPATATTTVDYLATGGTATGGVDYILNNGTLTFLPGQTAKTIPITLVADAIREGDQTIVVSLSDPSNAVLGSNTSATVTVTDKNLPPTVGFTTITGSAREGESTAVLAVTLSAMSELPVTVDFSVTGGTAVNGTDYNLSSGTLTFDPRQTVAYIPIAILFDSATEANTTIIVTLADPTNAQLGVKSTFTFTILDDRLP